jgi:hypothetical protein
MAIKVRGYGMHVSRKIRRLVDRRVAFELSRFGRQVRTVSVNLEDLNGPRGGIDKRCSMQADLTPGGRVRVEKTGLRASRGHRPHGGPAGPCGRARAGAPPRGAEGLARGMA